MTIVIGRKFGNRIIMMSDTMITDLNGVRHLKLPGRLKAIVLNDRLSVAFSGDADAALAAVRRAKGLLEAGQSVEEVVQTLTDETEKLQGRCEFLVASHDPDPLLRKITASGLSGSLSGAVIGNLNFLALLPNYAEIPGADEFEEYGCAVERDLNSRFIQIFSMRVSDLPDGVGGVPITLLASPFGHTYQSHAAVFSWDVIDLKIGVTEAQAYDQRTGMTEWAYSLQCPTRRGKAIVSLYLRQASVGYLFDPINFDEPIRQSGISQRDFEQAVKAL